MDLRAPAPPSLALLLAAACAAPRPAPHPAVPSAASEAFAAALAAERAAESGAGPDAEADAEAAARRALELAPDWVAPRRFLDELRRADLLGVQVLEEYRRELRESGEDARLLYLAARFEGPAGTERFARALRADPDFAWARHGVAWSSMLGGSVRDAVRHGTRALELARDPYERTTFAWALARYYRALGERERAEEVLSERLAADDLRPDGRIRLAVELAAVQLESGESRVHRRGAERALRLVEEAPLTDLELRELVEALLGSAPRDVTFGEIALALEGQARAERLVGQALLRERLSPLGLELWVHGSGDGAFTDPAALRTFRFALGRPQEAVEEWLGTLPRQVLAGDGAAGGDRRRPRGARVAAVVDAARALPQGADPADYGELIERLLEAGWFAEASALAALHPGEAWAASALARSQAGWRALRELERLLDAEASADPWRPLFSVDAALAPEDDAEASRKLDALLEASAPIFARANRWLGGEADAELLARELRASPRIGYGFAGSVVHPGPRFSDEDARFGRGAVGQDVPGLARELAHLGRFGVFGAARGAAPDGTILRPLWIEQRAGTHLGVPWSGTVAWCELADVESRPGRLGAAIAGAAVHEGYWIDVSALRGELQRWRALHDRFCRPGAAARVERALAVRGLSLDGGSAARTSVDNVLDEADRVRLATMAARGPSAHGCALGEMTLEEIVEATAIHEEGHLCDRTRFYPPGAHVLELLELVARSGFSGLAVARRLEYRAQLVALAAAPDPRLPLVDLLEAAAGGGSTLTPHAAAYTSLLRQLLVALDGAVQRAPEEWPEIDRGRTLVHQLHVLGPERLRGLALALARREGLDRD